MPRTDSLSVEYPTEDDAAPVPFGPGERLTYKVKIGIFGAGEATMSVEDVDTVRGHGTYRSVIELDAGLLGIGVHDLYTTWFDRRTLQSWRFISDTENTNYESYRHYEFYPDRGIWDREDNDEFGPLISDSPFDQWSFLYIVRQLPLEVGETYTFERYFKEEGNPVVVEVVRKDRRKTEGVSYNTIVVKPIIQTDRMFGEDGEAELHFSDDERRVLVYLKVDMPNFPGSLTWHLRTIEDGIPLNPESRALAVQARAARAQSEDLHRH